MKRRQAARVETSHHIVYFLLYFNIKWIVGFPGCVSFFFLSSFSSESEWNSQFTYSRKPFNTGAVRRISTLKYMRWQFVDVEFWVFNSCNKDPTQTSVKCTKHRRLSYHTVKHLDQFSDMQSNKCWITQNGFITSSSVPAFPLTVEGSSLYCCASLIYLH